MNFKKDDIIVPSDRYSKTCDLRRVVLAVSDTHYTIQFLAGKKLVTEWPISGVNGDHKLYEEKS